MNSTAILNLEDEEEEERCTICLTDFVHDEEIKQLDCAHKFHVECLETWFIDQVSRGAIAENAVTTFL